MTDFKTDRQPGHRARAGGQPRSLRPRRWPVIAAALAPAAVVVIFLGFAAGAGLSPMHAIQATAAIAVTQVLPGLMLWRLLRPRNGWWFEDIVLGFALGACLAIVTAAAAGTLGAGWLAWCVGPLLAVALMAHPKTRATITAAQTTPLPTAWLPAISAVALLLLMPTLRFFAQVPLNWPTGFRSTYLDMPFHLALAGQIAQRGPAEMPFVVGEPLHYHWFSHAWVAQVATAGQLPLDAVLFRFMPPVLAVLTVFAVAAAAVRLSDRVWTGPLAGLIAAGAGELDVVQGARPGILVNALSPSLGISIVFVMALFTVLVMRWKGSARTVSLLAVPVLTAAAAGAKGSAAPVVVAGVALTAVAAWLWSWPARRVILLDAILVIGSTALLYTLVFRGQTGGLSLDVVGSLSSIGAERTLLANGQAGLLVVALAAVLRLVSVLARGAGMLNVATVKSLRHDPAVALVAATGLAGAGAVLVFSHPGFSQWYFLRNAAPAMAIGSAICFAVLWDVLGQRRGLVLGAGIVIALSILAVLTFGFAAPPSGIDAGGQIVLRATAAGAVLVAGAMTSAVVAARPGLPLMTALVAVLSVSLVVTATVPSVLGHIRPPTPKAHTDTPDAAFAFSRDQIEAARWLRDHSGRKDLVATNRHCGDRKAGRCDSRRFFVSAYSERRVLVEGWAYTRTWAEYEGPEPNKAFRPFWDPELLALNDRFIRDPNDRDRQRLWDLGVRWLYIDKAAPNAAEMGPHATLRFDTEWASVFELRPPALATES